MINRESECGESRNLSLIAMVAGERNHFAGRVAAKNIAAPQHYRPHDPGCPRRITRVAQASRWRRRTVRKPRAW